MAITVDNIKQFKEHSEGVMGRDDHHADRVNEIILALVGGIVWKSRKILLYATSLTETVITHIKKYTNNFSTKKVIFINSL